VFYEYVDDLDKKTYGYSLTLNTWCINELEAEKAVVKPYLRPMSSMTKEEMDKIEEILGDKCIFDFMCNGDVSLHQGNFTQNTLSKLYDFYNSIHVDYRGLIPMGLAIEAPEGMYNDNRNVRSY
jgi:hypothetical protein